MRTLLKLIEKRIAYALYYMASPFGKLLYPHYNLTMRKALNSYFEYTPSCLFYEPPEFLKPDEMTKYLSSKDEQNKKISIKTRPYDKGYEITIRYENGATLTPFFSRELNHPDHIESIADLIFK